MYPQVINEVAGRRTVTHRDANLCCALTRAFTHNGLRSPYVPFPREGMHTRSMVIMGGPVLQAYVFIQTRVGMGPQVARDVGRIQGILSSEGVTGPYDVIAS